MYHIFDSLPTHTFLLPGVFFIAFQLKLTSLPSKARVLLSYRLNTARKA
jgi:hypothetical protein